MLFLRSVKGLSGLAFACVSWVWTGNAVAAPHVIFFAGTITTNHSYYTGASGPTGGSFAGWMTVNLDNAETSGGFDTGSTTASIFAASDGGCSTVENGTCESYHGFHKPVITSYLLSVNGDFYTPLTGEHYDRSLRQNYRNYPGNAGFPDGSELFVAERQQGLRELSGDLFTGTPGEEFDFVDTTISRNLQLSPFVLDNALLFGSFFDLAESPNFAAVPTGQTNFVFSNISTQAHRTNLSWGTTEHMADSFYLSGSLTHLYIVRPPHDEVWVPAPVPGSLALLLIGMAAFGARRHVRRLTNTAPRLED